MNLISDLIQIVILLGGLWKIIQDLIALERRLSRVEGQLASLLKNCNNLQEVKNGEAEAEG